MNLQSTTVSVSSQPSNVIVVTQPSRNTPPPELPLKSFHFVFGIIQMIIAGLMFVMEVASIASAFLISSYVGLYGGILIFLSGLFSMLAAKMNSRPLITTCMIFNILATVACFVGMWLASTAVALYKLNFDKLVNQILNRSDNGEFGYHKAIFMVICCVLEIILTIVHASLSCRSSCSCCMPQSTAGSGQHGIAYQTTFPAQDSGHPPQGVNIVGMPPPYAHGPQQAGPQVKETSHFGYDNDVYN